MMRVTLICVGKIKEDFYRKAVGEYQKRLGRYCRLAIAEVADEKTPDSAGAAIGKQIKEKEGKRILKHIKEDMYVIALAIDGKTLDSVAMSQAVGMLSATARGGVAFVVGGSLGLSDEVLKRADEAWSFSQMTFPHQLMRVIFLEQLYRSYRILGNEPYHK